MIARLVSVSLLLVGGCSSSAPEKPPETITEEQAFSDVAGVEVEYRKLADTATKQLQDLDAAGLDELGKAVADLAKRTEAIRLDGKHRRAYDTLSRIGSELGRLEALIRAETAKKR